MSERRSRRAVGEAGITTTQLSVVFPALLMLIMLVVQFGLWSHGQQVANAAAAEGTDAAQVPGAIAADGEAAVRSFLAQAGHLDDVRVRVERGTQLVEVEVIGDVRELVPGMSWSVTARSVAPVERFVPENER